MTVCDICNKSIKWEDGYVLTTNEVVTKIVYWEFAFKNQWSYMYKMDPKGNSLGLTAQRQASQRSGWLVCESCSKMFNFDRTKAKNYAKNHETHPPGAGPASVPETLKAAMNAWQKVFGSSPEPMLLF